MNTNFAVAEFLEANAEWRREKASEYPEDASRNNEAAAASDELATLFRNDDTDEDILAEYAEMFDADNPSVDPYHAHEGQGIVVKSIGFGQSFGSAEDFLLAVIAQVKGARHTAA